jgi:hypothetical protein
VHNKELCLHSHIIRNMTGISYFTDSKILSQEKSFGGPQLPGRMEDGVHETLSIEALVDAILKEAARFARRGCGCSPEDLSC